MGSYPVDDNRLIDAIDKLQLDDGQLQKPNIYNKYLPFYEPIKQHGIELFNEIRENLSRTIQLAQLESGLLYWSNELTRFISLYGFHFTKTDHVKLIQFYLSILTIEDLSYSNVRTCFNMLYTLLHKTKLITRDDLIIDWHLLYKWVKRIHNNHDKNYGLVSLPRDLIYSLLVSVHCCSFYFSSTATQEILDEFRPQIYPNDFNFFLTVNILECILPVYLPVKLHHQGFKLWLNEFFDLWDNIYNKAIWELFIIKIFANVAWYNIGYIDWEPWLSKIFTRILQGFSLPIGEMRMTSNSFGSLASYVAKWIVAMLSNENSCLKYLKELFVAMKSFYHPSNTGGFQTELVEFLEQLTKCFVDRIHLERKNGSVWYFVSSESSRLTEENITDFVNCIKDYVFMSIYNKNYNQSAIEACRYLAILRPELIIPTIIEKVLTSIDNMTEPHRFTSIRPTSAYPHGQTYVVPLLLSVLPGIDLNDYDKTMVTLDFYNAIFNVIICADCSSAIHIRTDLTEIEKQVCLSTSKFEDFINQFLDRIFQMIEILSTDVSNDPIVVANTTTQDNTIESKVISILWNIVHRCSHKIFETIFNKIQHFVSCTFLSSKVRKFAARLVWTLVKNKPKKTLKYFLPQTCSTIEKLMTDNLLTDHKGDIELTWYLILFSQLLCARGDTLFIYKQMIVSVFHRCLSIINKDAYETMANAANSLLQSLLQVYPMDYGLTTENINGPLIDFLPIRTWGQHVDLDDQLQVQYHLPNSNEIDFACEFINTFLYLELKFLNENVLNLSNNQRLRSLTIIQNIATGCLNMVPYIDHEKVQDIEVFRKTKYRIQDSIYGNQSKFQENLRLRLITDIGKFLNVLVENHSDDVKSITTALQIYSLSLSYTGASKDCSYTGVNPNKKLFKNKLSSKRHNPRFLFIKRIECQLKEFQSNSSRLLTEIDKQVIMKLFNLSINQYSEIRQKAQHELFTILDRYQSFPFQPIVDQILDILNTSNESNHVHQIKGCLYILLGNHTFFLPTKLSWIFLEKLWPSIATINHTKKMNTQNLIDRIHGKILQMFTTRTFVHNINEFSKYSAIALWRSIESNEIPKNQTNIQSYINLMETLNSIVKRDSSTWKQQTIAMSFMYLLFQRQVPIPLSCIRTFVDFLLHDNNELRKYAEKGIAAFCRLQKSPRTIAQKSLKEIYQLDARDDCLWVIKPAKTQIEWEETCFLDKSYYGYYCLPKTIKYSMNKRIRYTENMMPEEVTLLYDRFIDKDFINKYIQLVISNEDNDQTSFNETRFLIFKGLFRNFGLLFLDNFLEQLYKLVHEEASNKQKSSHRIAAEILAGIIRGSKYWTLDMIDELWKKLTPLLTELCTNLNTNTRIHWFYCFNTILENIDPRRMHRLIEFFITLIHNETIDNTLNDASRWYLMQSLSKFIWRIPSLWCEINKKATELLEHSSKSVRDIIANLFAIPLRFDITLLNRISPLHQLNVNDFMDGLCERLKKAIEIAEKTPLVNVSDEGSEMDLEARKSLNYIETVIQLLNSYLFYSPQPIKDGIIRIFPYLCEIETIAVTNEVLKNSLTRTRMNIGMNYLHMQFFEGFIQQLEQVCVSPKWQVRRTAVVFIQNMVFSNLFTARTYAKQIHKLILKCLFDEQFEVRMVASTTLSGLYQCGYIQVTHDEFEYFRMKSQIEYFTKIDGKKVTLPKNMVQRHGGVLGLCAIVLSSPYDILTYVSDALILLCEHLSDPHLIQKSVQQCLSEFRRTHYDCWHEHEKSFTEKQLLILNDVFLAHSYYT